MKRKCCGWRWGVLAVMLGLSVGGVSPAWGQAEETPVSAAASPEPPEPPAAPAAEAPEAGEGEPGGNRERGLQFTGEIVRFGADVTVEEGKEVGDVVCIFGRVIIKGRVRGDVVGVGSRVQVLGEVDGDLVAPLGEVELGPKARLRGDLVVPVGAFKEADGSVVEGERVVISWDVIKERFPALDGLKQWLFKGLFWGRPLPHQAGWWWVAALAFAVVYLLTALVFPKPITSAVETLGEQPVGSFFTGVLSVILFGPVLVLLAATGIGLLAVPLLICAAGVAFLFGKVAVCRFVGLQIGRQAGIGFLQTPLVTLVVGLGVFCLIYMIPVVGMLAWGVTAPLGLGAAVLATFRAFRSESRVLRQTATGPVAVGGTAGAGAPAGEAGLGASGGAGATVVPTAPAVPPAGDWTLLPRAGFWVRTLATVVDMVPFGVVMSGLGVVPPLLFVLWAAYHVAFWTWKGTTLGGMVFNLKLVRTDGHPVDLATALVRSLASFVSFIVLFLGFFWAGWNREKQSWHDLIAGTTMVRLPRGVSLL